MGGANTQLHWEPPNDRLAARLRGFGPLGILAIVVILAGNAIVAPLTAVLVLAWARWSRTPWREIGYLRPKSWIVGLAIGVVFGSAFKLLIVTAVAIIYWDLESEVARLVFK